MKAEERHRLQTNALADRLGRALQRAREGPSRSSILTVFLVVVLVVLVLFFFWMRGRSRTAQADSWVALFIGTPVQLLETSANTAPGRAARFQWAYVQLWELGITKLMSNNPIQAIKSIKDAQNSYVELAAEVDVKDDPVLGPEALYAIAVAEEALAVEDTNQRLDKAATLYAEMAERFPDSALGKDASRRAEELRDRTGPLRRRLKIQEFYEMMGRQVALRMITETKK